MEMLRDPDRPTAIFAGSDLQALGVLEAARVLGLNVPEDLSVVGYDDLPLAQWSSPRPDHGPPAAGADGRGGGPDAASSAGLRSGGRPDRTGYPPGHQEQHRSTGGLSSRCLAPFRISGGAWCLRIHGGEGNRRPRSSSRTQDDGPGPGHSATGGRARSVPTRAAVPTTSTRPARRTSTQILTSEDAAPVAAASSVNKWTSCHHGCCHSDMGSAAHHTGEGADGGGHRVAGRAQVSAGVGE